MTSTDIKSERSRINLERLIEVQTGKRLTEQKGQMNRTEVRERRQCKITV
jgi:hypothetical protein